jgi:serine/threonine-protein kinase
MASRLRGFAAVLALDLEDTQEPPTTEEQPTPRRPSEPLEPGDRYRLGGTIARGGMGEVLTAFDADIGRHVAIKRLRAPNPTPLALSRFLREARIQGRLDHPAIVPVHELAHDEAGRPFFAMKKLSGTTMANLLASPNPRFTRQQLLRAFADVCLAVEFAHTRGVLHRDIKPANILLGDFGEVYVLDWGIARVSCDPEEAIDPNTEDDEEEATVLATRPGRAVGTSGYMAPEQARGERVDARADVYALGCVLYEILAGLPLHPRGREEAIRSTLMGADARPSRWAPDIGPELDALCVRATALDRDERISSARELGEAVQRYLDGDRDLGLRQRLAQEHLSRALTAATDPDGRRIAMREAGQALALDPTCSSAAELVGHLMLEPPTEMPEQVRAELAEADHVTSHRFVWNLLAMYASLVLLLPILIGLGVDDGYYLTAFGLTGLAGCAVSVAALRTGRGLTLVHGVLQLLTFVLVARMFTPFLIAPAAVAVNLVAFAFHPDARNTRTYWVSCALGIACVIGTWAAEALGIVSRTVFDINGTLVLRSPVHGFESFPSVLALCLWVIILIALSGGLAFATARGIQVARERVHLQAWQVRQLVPDRR